MTEQNHPEPVTEQKVSSPKWNWTTKLIVGLVLVAIGFFFLIRFQDILGPILLSFILAYLIYPAANFLSKKIKIGWRSAVSLIYLVTVLVLLALLTWGGFAIIQQVQNLVSFIENNLTELPALLQNLANQTIKIGRFELSLSFLNNQGITDQIISTVQPLLGKAGNLLGKVFSGGASLIFWIVLILLISYFILAETGGGNNSLLKIKIPNYEEDLKRMGKELGIIWNAFIRGQLIVISIAILIFSIVLGTLGVQYFLGLALIAGLGRLIPYVGAWIAWISYGLVAVLQNQTPFGLTPFWFMVLVVIIALIIDQILDNFLQPKVMGNALHVHPGAVLVATLIGANLLGVIGVILAAPVLASLQLLSKYAVKKLTDMPPWEDLDNRPTVKQSRWWKITRKTTRKFWKWIKKTATRFWIWVKITAAHLWSTLKKGFNLLRQKIKKQSDVNDQNPPHSPDANKKI